MDHKEVAKRVAAALGEDNLIAAAHCATRLRLVVKDTAKIDQAALDDDADLKGTFEANGQYQIIVGPGDVNTVYKELVAITGVGEVSKDELKNVADTEKNPIIAYMDQPETIPQRRDAVFTPVTIFDTLNISSKPMIIQRALENMRETGNFITSSSESMKINIRQVKQYEKDWHKKLTLPFACLIFFFIGAPLGAIIRKGGLGTPSVISIFFFVVWYVISLSAEKLVEEGLVSAIPGMWASSYILLPVGIFLTYKASTDSVLMNVDTYLQFLRKIKEYIIRIPLTDKIRNRNYNDDGEKQ